jgi:hypothetical protein
MVTPHAFAGIRPRRAALGPRAARHAGALVLTPLLASSLAAQPPRPARPHVPIVAAAASGGVQGYTVFVKSPDAAPRAGINPEWLAVLDVPAGKYIANASAMFSRRDFHPEPEKMAGTMRIFCWLEGLGEPQRVMFFIHPPSLEPDPTVVIPFQAAGAGSRVALRCQRPDAVFVENIRISAIRVDGLTVR